MSNRLGAPVLVHLASGIGNIVLATPLLLVLARAGFVVDVLIDADYPGVGALLEGWDAIRSVYAESCARLPAPEAYAQLLDAVPPFCRKNYLRRYGDKKINRPPDALFYENEQVYYLEFARSLGCDISAPPCYFLPVPTTTQISANKPIVLAPGCKPAEMSAKRWPFYTQLAEQFDNVVVVGTQDDLRRFDRMPMDFPPHVRSLIGRLTLKDTAAVLSGAAVVVANDSGLGHLAAALGVPTILLFGPTPHLTLGRLPPNITVLRAGLSCEPCWFASRFRACARRLDCLNGLSVDSVAGAITNITKVNPVVHPMPMYG